MRQQTTPGHSEHDGSEHRSSPRDRTRSPPACSGGGGSTACHRGQLSGGSTNGGSARPGASTAVQFGMLQGDSSHRGASYHKEMAGDNQHQKTARKAKTPQRMCNRPGQVLGESKNNGGTECCHERLATYLESRHHCMLAGRRDGLCNRAGILTYRLKTSQITVAGQRHFERHFPGCLQGLFPRLKRVSNLIMKVGGRAGQEG